MCERTAFPTAAHPLVPIGLAVAVRKQAVTTNRQSRLAFLGQSADAATLRNDEGRMRARVNDVSALLGACDRRDRRN